MNHVKELRGGGRKRGRSEVFGHTQYPHLHDGQGPHMPCNPAPSRVNFLPRVDIDITLPLTLLVLVLIETPLQLERPHYSLFIGSLSSPLIQCLSSSPVISIFIFLLCVNLRIDQDIKRCNVLQSLVLIYQFRLKKLFYLCIKFEIFSFQIFDWYHSI